VVALGLRLCHYYSADGGARLLFAPERFDGSGYSKGLKGEGIPLGARIFAIADTLDAITSDRPYQRASSFEPAREVIRRLSGTGFDPQVVSVFLNLPEHIWPTIARNQRQIAGLSPAQRNSPAMLRQGLGVLP
jgi:HD-GYP domain-containing protein (c-di-GMP phosphodiesterase class II)